MNEETGTALMNWDEIYEQEARKSAELSSARSTGTKFIKGANGGRLIVGERDIPGSKINVVVLTSINENVYYEKAWTPDSNSPPDCFSLYHTNAVPDPSIKIPQSTMCNGCPKKEWGSDINGRGGKACKDKVRVALVDAGSLNLGVDVLDTYMITLPTMSIKPWDEFNDSLPVNPKGVKLPVFACVAELSCIPHKKYQFQLLWKLLTTIQDREVLGGLYAKKLEAEEKIKVGYRAEDEDESEVSNKM